MMKLFSSLASWEYHGSDQIETWFRKYTTYIAWGCLVTGPIAVSLIPHLGLTEKIVTIGLIGVFTLFCFVILGIAKRGHYMEASWGLMSALYIVVTFVTLLVGGVQSKVIDVYYLLAMASGFFLNKKGQIFFLLLSAATIFCIWLIEYMDLYTTKILGDASDPAYFLVPGVILTLLSFLSRSIFEHLADKSQEMEGLVVERTAQLNTAKNEAVWRSEQMENFLTNMSHEIRTPLTAIIGAADILDEMEDEEREDTIDMIKRGGSRLMDTLNSVLELTNLDNGGNRTLAMKIVNVTEIVEDTISLFTKGAQEKGLVLRLVSSEPVQAMINPPAFSRVLQNIVGNAIKFTKKGAVYIEVKIKDNDGVIKIADTGIGISPDFIPHVFDKFRQESSGHGRHHEGNGIGLSISHRLMKLMGGKILVESEVNEGSIFSVVFPVAKNIELSGRENHGDGLPVPPQIIKMN